MSTFNDCINTIIHKIHNKTKLNYTEKKIYKKFNTYVICDMYINNNTNKDNYINIIQSQFIQNKVYIIKLIFSNDMHIYVSLDILTNIEYFKIMFDGYVFSDNCIIDVVMFKEMDNYDIMESVISYEIHNTYDIYVMTFLQLYNTVLFLDFINYDKIFKHITNNKIINYDNINVDYIEHIHNILTQNSFKCESNYFVELLKNCDEHKNVFDTNVFNKCILNSQYSYNLILKYKKTKYYDYLTNIKEYHDTMVLDLLDVGDDDAWLTITNIIDDYVYGLDSDDSDYDSDDDHSEEVVEIHNLLMDNIDKVTDVAFDYFGYFETRFELEVMIKFNDVENLKNVTNKIIKNKDIALYDKLLDYLRLHNDGNDEAYDKLATINMDKVIPINTGITLPHKIQQIISYIPFDYKEWNFCSDVYSDYNDGWNANKIIICKYNADCDITKYHKIMICHLSQCNYDIYPVSKVYYSEYSFKDKKYIPYVKGTKYVSFEIENANKVKYIYRNSDIYI